MFRICKGDAILGMTENPTYIKQAPNGSFILCPEPEASGIAFEGAVYHLPGRDALGDAETVVLEAVDAGQEITKTNTTNGIAFVTMAEAGQIDDVTAGEHADLFTPWAYPVKYTEGQLRQYGGKLYRCISAHTSQVDWTPDVSVSLWKEAADPSEEWPAWSQPRGAHDAYNKGDKVSHNDQHWTSDVDANVWEPGVYGWSEAEE